MKHDPKMVRAAVAAVAVVPLLAIGATAASADTGDHNQGRRGALTVTPVLEGQQLTHTFAGPGGAQQSAPLTGPDDLTHLGHELFVAFQNGVGAQGQPAASGNTASTVVAFDHGGRVLRQWDVTGKVDGLSADAADGRLVATVDEDGSSSLYVIDPASGAVQHYTYDQSPLPHNGGTDAISFYGGRILISASAPGSAGPSAPAVYSVSLDPQTLVASVSPLFADGATATAANGPDRGRTVALALTDPDSNEVVPAASPRFGGEFVLDSQGDQQQIYVSDPGGPAQRLSVLSLDQAVNDTAWATGEQGNLYASDSTTDSIYAVSGQFRPGTAFVAVTPCDSNSAPANCSTANSLGVLDLATGHVAGVPLSASLAPGGLIFVGAGEGDGPGDQR